MTRIKSLSQNRLGEGDSPILLRRPAAAAAGARRKIGTVPGGFGIGSKPYAWLLPLLVVAGCSNSGSAPTPTDSAQPQAAKLAPAARRVIGGQQQDDAAAQAEMEQALADSAKKADA